MTYEEFVSSKRFSNESSGIEADEVSKLLFPFQQDIVKWALKRGRAAIFADCGMGKTAMQLEWARQVRGRVLIAAPLAVSAQTVREGAKFGVDVSYATEDNGHRIIVTNYERLENFDPAEFHGIVLDESSILKNYTGKFRNYIIEKWGVLPFRLAATATPAPNDYMELGNHAEFCGIMSYTDMLSTFFVHDAAKTQDWRLKGHAESEFWKWMASWSCMLHHPRDLGYQTDGYDLPTLHQHQHIVDAEYKSCIDMGTLFPMQAQSLGERLKARRATIDDRVAKAAELANGNSECWVIWCNLNDESSKLAACINGAVEVSGADSDAKKEEKLEQFANGNIRVLITKPSICGAGLNWQHCHNTIFVGLNDSFEQVYQATRRFWRFGQKNEVHAHFIASELEGAVVANIRRKEAQAKHMMQQMVKHMADLSAINVRGAVRESASYIPQTKMEIPQWIM